MASGPFANHLTGRLDNTEIFGIMEKALTYQNLIAIIGYIIGFVVAAFLMFFMFKKIKRETVKINAHRKVYIMSILGFVCLITFLFAILVLSLKPLWPEKWPEAAQATLAAAITAGIVSILGIYLKFIFDQISNETAYSQKISENMMSKLHTYAEDYYLPLTNYANFSAYQLKKILTKAKASTEEKQLALFSIAKYFRYGLRLSIEKGGIVFLKKFDSELYLKKLHRSARWNLELNTNQICRLQKSIDLEEETFLDFSKKIQCDSELMQIYETFEKWLKNNSKVKNTIIYFRCYSQFMRYELNSIYRPWYQRKAPQISNECKEVLRTFKKLEEIKEKKDKGKIKKKEYEERKKEEEENLRNSILGFFEE